MVYSLLCDEKTLNYCITSAIQILFCFNLTNRKVQYKVTLSNFFIMRNIKNRLLETNLFILFLLI